MIVVTVEVWPKGDPSKAEKVAVMSVKNDCEGTRNLANYEVLLFERGKPIASGKVDKHDRSLSIYHLVLKALRACGITTVKREE